MSDSYKEWLNRAKSNLYLAKESNRQEVYFEDLCFQAQQAAEKALKAVMILLAIEPPRSHNFNILLLKLGEKIELPEVCNDVIDLNDYAVQTRYPGDYTPVDIDEYHNAIEIAERIVTWASEYIQKNS